MNKLKTCTKCKLSKNVEDFILNRDECYKCEYAKKILLSTKKSKRRECKLCGKKIPTNRWIYCDEECASLAKKNNKHWTNKFKPDSKGWKKRFVGMNFKPL